ncbi:MAG: hypothetical protein M9907_05155 [Burkholderiaceae bacterium]|nr:hypothetical protein [Burkholderiaceae bacterium]
MSTLVTTHEGLDRVIRGGQAVADMFGRGPARPAGRNAARAPKASRGVFAGLIARIAERARKHRQDRLFEQLMHDDPRVYADVQAAAARQEWR